jgi:histone deacetylase 6
MSLLAEMTEEQIRESQLYYDHHSLYVCNSTTYCAQLSCGGVVDTCLAVARGEIEKGFAIVRPPGHHAEPDEHMGFCFFNNVCVAARVVQRDTNIKRVLILDWYAHRVACKTIAHG